MLGVRGDDCQGGEVHGKEIYSATWVCLSNLKTKKLSSLENQESYLTCGCRVLGQINSCNYVYWIFLNAAGVVSLSFSGVGAGQTIGLGNRMSSCD